MLNIVLFCQSERDFEIASGLVDRVLAEWGPPGLEEMLQTDPAGTRTWVRDDAGQPFFALERLNVYASSFGLRRPYGRFDSRPHAKSTLMARTLFTLARRFQQEGRIDATIVIWNLEHGGEGQRQALEQTRNAASAMTGSCIVMSCPNPSTQGWVLSGFVPQSDSERAALAALERELGFDPTRSPDQLGASDGSAASIARVLRILTNDDPDRQRRCWQVVPLDALWRSGDPSGLRAFLQDLQDGVIPRCPVRAQDPAPRLPEE